MPDPIIMNGWLYYQSFRRISLDTGIEESFGAYRGNGAWGDEPSLIDSILEEANQPRTTKTTVDLVGEYLGLTVDNVAALVGKNIRLPMDRTVQVFILRVNKYFF